MWEGSERRSPERLLMDRLREEAAEVRRSVQQRVEQLLDADPRPGEPEPET